MNKSDIVMDGDALRWLDKAICYLDHEINDEADEQSINFNDGRITIDIIRRAFKFVTGIEPDSVDKWS